MVRGRRTRNTTTSNVTASAASNRLVPDDSYCASPKRKDCKVDNAQSNLKAALLAMKHRTMTSAIKTRAKSQSPNTLDFLNGGIGGAKTRSQSVIRQFFKVAKPSDAPSFPTGIRRDDEVSEKDEDEFSNACEYSNGDSIGAELEVLTSTTPIDLTEENTCDARLYEYMKKTVTKENGCFSPSSSSSSPRRSSNNSTVSNSSSSNIFLQEPVLSLNVDKSPNQASSIKINKLFQVEPVFSSNSFHLNLNGQFNKIVTLNGSPKRGDSTDSAVSSSMLLNWDSNSCDSGVVIDNMLHKTDLASPSRRRKPTTPHRIVCPSPVKHTIVETSPSSALSQMKLINSKGNNSPAKSDANTVSESAKQISGRRNPKSKRRLNTNQSENSSSMTAPQLIGGVILTNQNLKKLNGYSSCSSNNQQSLLNSQKSILNSSTNPTAEQNTNNNFKTTFTNGFHHPTQLPKYRQTKSSSSTKAAETNEKLTDFFPVRRSLRKTKKVVQEEIMRTFEKAIFEGSEEGLKVEDFKGKGRGVVADRCFRRGEFVVEYIGDLINMSEANIRERKYALDENTGCYMYYFKHHNQQYCIDATAESGKLGRLVNHSRNGNLITKVVVIKSRPHLILLAKDEIQPGEELTYDYGDRSKDALLHHPWLAL